MTPEQVEEGIANTRKTYETVALMLDAINTERSRLSPDGRQGLDLARAMFAQLAGESLDIYCALLRAQADPKA